MIPRWRKSRRLRDHGQARKYFHDFEGYNGRLDAIQAGILLRKVALSGRSGTNRDGCAREKYNRLLANDRNVVPPYEPSWSRAIYHLYVIRTSDRDGLIEFLKTKTSAPESTTRFRCTNKSHTLR